MSIADMTPYSRPLARGYSLYPPPNGGNRILPSMYASLRTQWLQATGRIIDPSTMNAGHLENSLKLLNESHGNLLARTTSLLGRMASHFRNDPEMVRIFEDLCLRVQRKDVAEVYPIFNALRQRLWDAQSGDDIDFEAAKDLDALYGLDGW